MLRQRRLALLLVLAIMLVAGGTLARQAQPRQTPPTGPPWPTGPVAVEEIDELLKQFNVPGVSVAVIKDFTIEWAQGYGVADVETGAPVTTDTMFQAASISKTVAAMASMKSRSERHVHARSGRQHDPEVVEAAGRRVHERRARHAAQPDESHLRHGRRLRISRLRAGRATADGAADPRRRSRRPTVGPVRLERAPLTGYKYSGGGVMIQQLALTDAVGRPFAEIARDWVLTANRHDQQHVRTAAAGCSGETGGPRARSQRREHGRALARLSRAGRGRPLDDADRSREVPDRSADDAVGRPVARQVDRVLTRPMMLEMVTPVGVGPYAVGFADQKQGRGLVLRCTAAATGASSAHDRPPPQGLRTGRDDQRRRWRYAHRRRCGVESRKRTSGTSSIAHPAYVHGPIK